MKKFKPLSWEKEPVLSKDLLPNISSKDLPQEFSKLVNENFDELIGEEPKKETLEEAAYRLSAEKFEPKHIGFMLGVIEGAKWQAERMYSEEDMLAFSEFISLNFPNQNKFLQKIKPFDDTNGFYTTKELLEKFKKK